MSETTGRIRWEEDGNGGFEGHAGTAGRLFDLWKSPSDSGVVVIGEWVLTSQLPVTRWRPLLHGHDPETLKTEAERWLEDFISSLGAVFPAPAAPASGKDQP